MRVIALLASIVLAGCSGMSLNPTTWFGRGDTGPKMAGLPELRGALPVRTLWQASVGPAGNAAFSAALAGGAVFAAAADGTVARFDAATGAQSWRVKTGSLLSGGVGADSQTIAVGTGEGEVIALSANAGELRWRARVSSEVLAPPVVAGDLVLVRSSDSRLFALDAKDGRRRWVYQRSVPSLTVRGPVGLVVSRGFAFAGFPGGKLIAISLANGAVRWEATVALPRGATELERVSDVVGLPQIIGREICAVAYQGRVACFDSSNGNALWSREMSSTAGLGVDSRFVFVSDDRGSIHALDRAGGTSVWKQDRLFLRKLTAPLALGREIAVADVQGYVHFLARDTGGFIGRTATDGSPVLANPVAIDSDRFIVQTRNGNLYSMTVR